MAAASVVVLAVGVLIAVAHSGSTQVRTAPAPPTSVVELLTTTSALPSTVPDTIDSTTTTPTTEANGGPTTAAVPRPSARAAAPVQTSSGAARVESLPTTTTTTMSPPSTTSTTTTTTTTTTLPPAPAHNDSAVAGQVVAAMNKDRAANGVDTPLHTTPCLSNLAAGWAESMGTNGPNGSLAHNPSFNTCNGDAAENIGRWTPCSAAEMEGWWMGSAPHRANILNAHYTSVGVGVYKDGKGQCWFAVDFGP